jgi:bifunctional non-homologous end joining protein LigD
MNITVDGYTIELSNLDKNLFGKSNINKSKLIEYYRSIASIMVKHTKQRAVSMHRFPDGIDHEGFFHKNIPDYFPTWIDHVAIKRSDNVTVNYPVINNSATLIYLANYACITPHVWLSKTDKVNFPDRIIFDLDPSKHSTFADVQYAAQQLKTLLDDLQLPSFYMLTGSRGVHVVVPIKRKYTFDETREIAHDIAIILVQQDPHCFTIDIHKSKRGKRIFIDWLRNSFGATSVAPYALRPLENAPVAMPITWQALSKKNMSSQNYTIKNALKHCAQYGDIWRDINKHAVTLTQAKKLIKTRKKEE